MGNLAHNSFTISVTKPEYEHFNFHKDYLKPSSAKQITFPSFMSSNDAHQVTYCTRSAFNDRQYELSYEQDNQSAVLNFKKLKENGLDLWKNIGVNEIVLLKEGYVIRLGSTEFEVKKVCRSFADLEQWEENLKTSSDVDPREKSFQMMSSRKLQGSKLTNGGLMFQSRNIMNGQSMMSSFGFDQQGDFCRYCYGRDSTSANPLLNLCICSGSVKFCHYFCMKNWISSRSKTKASDCYEYFEYDMSCEVCKQKINRTVTHKGKKYTLYSQSLIHPPFIVLSYRNDSDTKVQEYIINFDYTPSVRIGRNANCDIKLKEEGISGEHCELLFENGEFLLKNLNPTYGTFIRIDKEWNFSPIDNQLELVIGEHLVTIREKSQSCFWSQPLKLRVEYDQQ